MNHFDQIESLVGAIQNLIVCMPSLSNTRYLPYLVGTAFSLLYSVRVSSGPTSRG